MKKPSRSRSRLDPTLSSGPCHARQRRFRGRSEISALLPDTPILMCTMHISPHVESEAQKSGIRRCSQSDSGLLRRRFGNSLKTEPPSDPGSTPENILPAAVAPEPSLAAAISATAPDEAAGEPVPPSLPKSVA